MNRELIRVLIVEDSKCDALVIREMLGSSTDISYEIEHSENLSDCLERLGSDEFDVLLLDLGLPESQGLATLLRIQKEYPDTPKIVLTGHNSASLALEAVQSGAQDYLEKGKFDREILQRSLRYAIKRQRLLRELKNRMLKSRAAEAQTKKLESIGQLAAGIAHEINTPTQFVGDNIRFLKDAFSDLNQLLEKHQELLQAVKENSVTEELVTEVGAEIERVDLEFLNEEVPQAIEQSIEGVERVARIVKAMKDFSHPGENALSYIDLNAAINSTLMVAGNEWKYVAEMKTDFDSSLTNVPCLPGEFNQVILNLVVNAAHAIEETDEVKKAGRKGTISVSTRRKGEWAEIRINDTGVGIEESAKERIFDPFFTTKEVGKGTGQGLYIAHQVIAEKHLGRIWVESELGKGTTFIILLPVEREEAKKERMAS